VSAVLGIGVDILAVERMRSCLGSPQFMRRVFTEAEVEASASYLDPQGCLARVFAGKEAVFKCLGVDADALDSWTDIEVSDMCGGPPAVGLRGGMAAAARRRGAEQVLLSLSGDAGYVAAFAVLVGSGGA
jgi:phosphopantetheine--protein transferase-like protein